MVAGHRAPVLLFNCRECDDLQRLHEEARRSCLCGKSSGSIGPHGEPVVVGPARIIEIPIEEYDGAGPGDEKKWIVRP